MAQQSKCLRFMTSTIPTQTTFTINQDLANLMAFFLELHMYEFRRLYDQQQGIELNPVLPGIPSLESRMAFLELRALLKGEEHAL
jgi:hypothetical protein